MERGSLQDTPALELLVRLHREGATGCLQLLEGRLRRDFFFRDGRLVATRSNLKTEALAALRANHPDADAASLARLQASLRVAGALSMRGSWTFEPGATPPRTRPADLLAALWQVLADRGDEPSLQALLPAGCPELADAGALDALPLPDAVRRELLALDGGRPVDEVVEFSDAEPVPLLAALVLGHHLGAVSFRAEPTGPHVLPTGRSVEADPELARAAAHPPAPEAAPSGEDRHAALRGVLRELEQARDYFEVLGVPWDASEAAYRKRYFELARRWHPDAFQDDDDEARELAEAIFARIAEAWETLGDAERRKAYIDRHVHGVKSEEDLAMEKVQAILAAEQRFKQALRDFQAGRIVQAAQGFQACVDAVPEENEFQAYLGYCTWRIHRERDPDRAAEGEDRLKNAVDNQPKMVAGWVLLGRLYADRDMPDLARRCFVRALKLNPSDADAQREMRRLKARGAAGRRGRKGRPGERGGDDRQPFWKKVFGRRGD